MNLNRLTIGEMAKINYVSVQTLRLYDKNNLLKPIEVDPVTNYRYYDINQSSRLDMIQHLQRCGLTLNEIYNQLKSHNIEDIKSHLEKNISLIDNKIAKLKNSKKAIERTLNNYKKYESLPNDNIIFKEYIEERYIYKHKTKYNFFENSNSNYELMIREFNKEILNKNIPSSFFHNIGTIIDKNYIKSKNFNSNEVFIFIDSNFKNLKNVEKLNNNLYICICSNNFHKEKDLSIKLLNEIEKIIIKFVEIIFVKL